MQPMDRTNIGVLVLVLSWLIGTAGLNLGLLKEGADLTAILIFLVACVLWLLACKSLRSRGRAARAALIALVVFWILNLGFAAVVGRGSVYKTTFFAVSFPLSVFLLFLAGWRTRGLAQPK